MQTLIGLVIIVGVIWGLIYLLIWILKGGKKGIYHKTVNQKKAQAAWTSDSQFVFEKKILGNLVLPTVWIAVFSTLFFSSTDLSTAIFSVVLLSWFMVFRIYFIIRSRKDKVILNGNKVSFFFSVGDIEINAVNYHDANLEFRKVSSYNSSVVVTFLIFGPGSDKEVSLANAALSQNPHEVFYALQQLNPHLKLTKLWNNTIKKKIETMEFRAMF